MQSVAQTLVAYGAEHGIFRQTFRDKLWSIMESHVFSQRIDLVGEELEASP
jgi:hypothetical protein